MIAILGGARRLNEAGINNASFGEHQSGSGDAGVDPFKDLLAEVVLLEQMTELENRGFVRRTVRQRQPHELSSNRVLVKEVLHLGIAHVVGDLKQINALSFDLLRASLRLVGGFSISFTYI